MIQDDRVQVLKGGRPAAGRYVLYWMQASQRAEYNHALEFAIEKANELDKPLVVFFGITGRFPDANLRHYHFMLEGLARVGRELKARGIKLVVRLESPVHGAIRMAGRASMVITDRGYLRVQKKWRKEVAASINCPLFQVETDVIVPVETASPKEDYAAATIRPKITTKLDRYLVPLKKRRVARSSLSLRLRSGNVEDFDGLLSKLEIDRSVGPAPALRGGTGEARRLLTSFMRRKLDHFAERRNDPGVDYLSNMSPYLHFGQISPLYIALRIKKARSPGTAAYLEELIVRRELSMNFVHYNSAYDSFTCLPEWARKTLSQHKGDRREYVYTLRQFELAATHDPYWNAAQREMVLTGKMHGYMRMYWGKKILEWTRTPGHGFKVAAYLNNKYELDGRDPNGFAGVAWCFGKHDRPWAERPVFGKVRYMNDKGLRRKFDIDAYVRRIEALARKSDISGRKGEAV
jgi:deoxyribodipyrimidine photo-lyase